MLFVKSSLGSLCPSTFDTAKVDGYFESTMKKKWSFLSTRNDQKKRS